MTDIGRCRPAGHPALFKGDSLALGLNVNWALVEHNRGDKPN